MSVLEWAGAAVFVLAAAGFLAQGLRTGATRYGGAAAAAGVVTGLAYAGLALDAGAELRYLAWLAAVGVALLELWWLADADATWLAGLLVPAVAAIAAAFVAGVAGAPPASSPAPDVARPGLYEAVVAAALLLVALGVLFARVSTAAGRRPGDVAAHFSVLRNVALVGFVGYAAAWVASAVVVGGDALALVYLLVDLVAVVAFNALLLRNPDALTG